MFHRRRMLLLSVFAAIVVMVLIGFQSDYTGVAWGVEWSPQRFRHRSFRYYQIVGLQVTPSVTREWESDLEQYLHREGFIPDSNGEVATWELVRGFAPGVRGWHGPAKMLCKGLGCFGGDSKEWVSWSVQHPELSRVLWPEIVRRAQHAQYFEVYVALINHGNEVRSARNANAVKDVLFRSDLLARE